MKVSAPRDMQVVNGTEVQLKCSFMSTQPLSENTLSVSWTFRPYGQTTEETVCYYLKEPFLPPSGRFKDHVRWSGDVLQNDASITLQDVQFSFNGTFSCQVRNPPDVHGFASETVLQVVQSVKLSEIRILAATVGGAIVVVFIILVIFIIVRYCQHRRGTTDVVQHDTEWKHSSVWASEEEGTLKLPEKILDTDSLSREESEAESLKELDDEMEEDV
ncbi:myelin protein zero-like protein 2 isoform X1 [Brachyhypopomus gauderio]